MHLLICRKKTMTYRGNQVPMHEVTPSFDTYWDKLTKQGFSFNKKKPLIKYIDEVMTATYGPPDSGVLWTRDNLHAAMLAVYEDIKSKMTKDCEDSG